jgi:hypothetical protein
MNGAETCGSGIDILNILFTLHMHFVGFNYFNFENAWFKLQNSERSVLNLFIGLISVNFYNKFQFRQK